METNSPALPILKAKQSALKMWLNRENELFSLLLDEESISNANVLRVSHAILAFLFLISCSESTPFPTCMNDDLVRFKKNQLN